MILHELAVILSHQECGRWDLFIGTEVACNDDISSEKHMIKGLA